MSVNEVSARTEISLAMVGMSPLLAGGLAVTSTEGDGNKTIRAVPEVSVVSVPQDSPRTAPPGNISKLGKEQPASTIAPGTGLPDGSTTVTSSKTLCSVRSWTT